MGKTLEIWLILKKVKLTLKKVRFTFEKVSFTFFLENNIYKISAVLI